MSTTAVSGLFAIVVCAALQGNPLRLQLALDPGHACLLHQGATVACLRWPPGWAMVESQPARG